MASQPTVADVDRITSSRIGAVLQMEGHTLVVVAEDSRNCHLPDKAEPMLAARGTLTTLEQAEKAGFEKCGMCFSE